jgi:XTP/dITP diphosphohydrolase
MGRVELALAEADAREPEKRGANFTCALTLATPDGACHTFEGKIFGTLVWPPRGTRGFGYDPVFMPEGGSETFGEMEPEEKQGQSHRARAFELFREACLE